MRIYFEFEAEALDVEEEKIKDRYRKERMSEHENSKSYIIVLLPCEPNLEQSQSFFCSWTIEREFFFEN